MFCNFVFSHEVSTCDEFNGKSTFDQMQPICCSVIIQMKHHPQLYWRNRNGVYTFAEVDILSQYGGANSNFPVKMMSNSSSRFCVSLRNNIKLFTFNICICILQQEAQLSLGCVVLISNWQITFYCNFITNYKRLAQCNIHQSISIGPYARFWATSIASFT